MPEFCRTTVYKALKRPDGRLVCIDLDYLTRTSKVVASQRDYDIALGQGWVDDPQEAMRRLEAKEDAISEAAAVRAYDDRRMSDKAKAESEAIESTTVRHLTEIPEQPKRPRGRPRKIQPVAE